MFSEATEYAADMNVALAYHVCADHAKDDKSASARAQMKLLAKPYARVKELHPETCAAIESRIAAIAEIERDPAAGLDAPANETGRLLGAVYAWKDDLWAPTLGDMGAALGRFIYVMDAYDDLAEDEKRGRFNPLLELRKREDFEEMCKKILVLHIAECAREFESSPLSTTPTCSKTYFTRAYGPSTLTCKSERKKSNDGSLPRARRISQRLRGRNQKGL